MRIRLLRRLLSVLVLLALTVPLGAQEFDYEAELLEIDREIAEAEREAAQYSGGLILTMTKLRIELLKSSRALIELSRLQDAVRRHPGSSVFQPWFSDPRAALDEVEPKFNEIGLLCGPHDRYAIPVIINESQKRIAFGGTAFTSYTEMDDVISLGLTDTDGKVAQCELNRYTLEAQCKYAEGSREDWTEKCRLAGNPQIPSSGTYWLSCGVPGKPQTDNTFKIVLGENSTIAGGYLIWKNICDGGVTTEECNINRINAAVGCSALESVPQHAPVRKRWDVLDEPRCRVLQRRF